MDQYRLRADGGRMGGSFASMRSAPLSTVSACGSGKWRRSYARRASEASDTVAAGVGGTVGVIGPLVWVEWPLRMTR